ncbi:MAG TPA: ATP-binding protein, partial [Spongiibacteraceae bacterium]|nr:ATP-binding protein [Spongiibacteraceae bacterium]
MAKRAWWIGLFLLCCWQAAHAALAVGDADIVLRDSGELYFFIDRNHELSIDTVRDAARPWQRVTPQTHLSRYDTSTLWLHLRIATGDVDRQLVLYQVVPRRIDLQVYTQLANSAAPVAVQALTYPHYLFPIHVPAGNTMDIYLRARGNLAEALNDLQLWPMQALLAELPQYSAIEWANIAVMVLVAFTAFIMWLFVRQRLLLLFALLVSAQWLVYVTGHSYSLVWWSTTPAFSARCYQLTTPISTIIGIAFTRAFLDLPRYAPRLNRVAEMAMMALAIAAGAMLISSRSYDLYALPIVPLNWLFLVGVSFYLYRRNINRGHAIVMLACWLIWICVLAAFMLSTLLGSDRMLLRYVSDVSMQLRTVLFVICLGYHYQQTVRGEERARSDAQAKSEFLARMSHEIRTPMNGILGMSELLRDSGLNNTQRRYNDIVNSSANALLTVINDILDFSKIQAGHMSIEHIAFDLHELAADAVALLRVKAGEKDLKLELTIQDDVPAWVIGDPTRIRQILINFLSNAIKFTDMGGVHLKIAKHGYAIRMAVGDTGCGIASEVQPHLFEAFMQADESIARRYGGTGLGLAISKQLAELMGSKIGVESIPGGGSTFWIELPLPKTQPPAAVENKAIAPPSQQLKLLVVEDNFTNQVVAEAMLEKLGHQFRIVSSGADAVSIYQDSYRDIDIILMDCEMPEMSGYEA